MEARKAKLVVCLMLLVLGVAGFHALPQCDFIGLDDSSYVEHNPVINQGLSWFGIKWAFTGFHSGYWIPITWLSLLLDAQIYGLKAGGYHLTNFLFHLANSLLLFLLLNRASKKLWLSFIVAGLFLIHPIQVESVAWITERKDVLSVFFWMLTLHAYFSYVKNPKILTYLLMLILYALGLMAKPMIVTLPFVMLLFDFWPLNRFSGEPATRSKKLIMEKAPLFLMTVVFSALTVITQGATSISDLETLPVLVRLENLGPTYLAYLGNIFWPTKLAVFYPAPTGGVGVITALLSWGILALISFLVVVFRKRGYLFVGWFLFAGVLFPVSGIMQSGLQGMADRFAYIPVIGIFIMLVYGIGDIIAHFPRTKTIFAIAGSVLLLSCTLLTARQTSYWKDTVSIMEHTVSVTKNNWFAEQMLGSALVDKGKLNEAMVYLNKSMESHPDFAPTLNSLGLLMHSRAEYAKAVEYFRAAIKNSTRPYNYYNNLGRSLDRSGKTDSAIEAFNKALALEPNYYQIYYNLGLLYQRSGKIQLAKTNYEKALKLNPGFAPVYSHLGMIALNERNFDKALEYFQKDPNKYNLGRLLVMFREYTKALPVLETFVDQSPNDWEARILLAQTLTALNRFPEAQAQYEAVLQGSPDNKQAADGLKSLLER